jgi:nucleoside-diphosphate-sugar epimerase
MVNAAKRVLLIGASKHIGYHVLEMLATQPDEYTLFVLARTPAASIAPFKGKENVTFVKGDAKDLTTVKDILQNTMNGNIDYIICTVGTIYIKSC